MRTLPSYRIRIAPLALIVLGSLLSGCASDRTAQSATAAIPSGVQVTKKSGGLLGFLKPYRVDIQQGNFVSKEMVAQLKPGMTRDQVRFVLGTPLLVDLFHSDRWDYEFRLAKSNGELMSSRVTVFFKDTLMERYEGGDNLLTEQDYLSLIAGSRKSAMKVSSDTPIAPTITNK